ncbi:uncharacterized protein LOC123512343 [Portunus trituberculatus]|uniref:uncharacterized protein LOC123512343 n=1 Tax=Portunus trituberculatus TaxID=210409 RepID=UPI001E1CFDED|nr:uncharacterized protein LOC123512343 [Portunus trituberculatus]
MLLNPTKLLVAAPLVCLALTSTCVSLVAGAAEGAVSSPEWSARPVPPRHLGPPSPWEHAASDAVSSLLTGQINAQNVMRYQTIPERTSRPLRIMTPGVPKRLYFAPRLGKRSPSQVESLDERGRRDATSYKEDPEDAVTIPYSWWWPSVSVRRSNFSPRPGKRGEGEIDLPYDYYDPEDDEDEETEDEDEDEGVLQDKRDSTFAFSPRLGKRVQNAAFAFAPRPGKKDNFAFAPRPGKKAGTNFAFAPRPGKRTNFAFAPRPGKKSNFAFAPRPGKKTFAFSPRLGKKADFAFAPRPGKRSDSPSETGDRQTGETWWIGEGGSATVTTQPPFLPPRLE